MKKLSSYQKLKQRVEKLEKEKRILVLEPNSVEAMNIRAVIVTGQELTNNILWGSRHGSGNGILDLINQNAECKESIPEKFLRLAQEFKQLQPDKEQKSIKTGRKLIEIFNDYMNSKLKQKNGEKLSCKEIYGIPVEEVSYYPENFFIFDNKMYWIEGDVISVQKIPELKLDEQAIFIRDPQTVDTPFVSMSFHGFYPLKK
ncbi:hypothetical protein [Draconibacterium mangrovi]|uniref:hypothetical protein n=1 Tax=Draconibacterium mangrovi TaxID=2697469 RepID=UPI0013D5877B|nr:hypothetical protein [Draconibacterium mangrovi]